MLNLSNKEICHEILNQVGNKEAKVVVNDTKNSYYFFLNNTLYINDKGKQLDNICTIAHECRHSIQNKIIQISNFILSNIELIMFVIYLILLLCNISNNVFNMFYIVISVVSMIIRLYLEIDATVNSIGISKRYLESKNVDKVNDIVKNYKKRIILTFPLFLIMLFGFKILRLLLVILI